MIPSPLLRPRLDHLARLVALGWDVPALAAETGLLPHWVSSQLAKLRRALGLPVGRPVFLARATYGQVLRRWAARYVTQHPLPPDRACLHCQLPLVRAHWEEEHLWEKRQRLRICRQHWAQWLEAKGRP